MLAVPRLACPSWRWTMSAARPYGRARARARGARNWRSTGGFRTVLVVRRRLAPYAAAVFGCDPPVRRRGRLTLRWADRASQEGTMGSGHVTPFSRRRFVQGAAAALA